MLVPSPTEAKSKEASRTSTRPTAPAFKVSAKATSVVKLPMLARSVIRDTVMVLALLVMVPQLVVASEVFKAQDVLNAPKSQLSVADSVVDSARPFVVESLISTDTMLVSQGARVESLATAMPVVMLVVASIRIEDTMLTTATISRIRPNTITTLLLISIKTLRSITTSLVIMVVRVVSTRTPTRTTTHLRIRETRVATVDTAAMALVSSVVSAVKVASLVASKAVTSKMMASVEPESLSSRLRLKSVPKRSKMPANSSSRVSLRPAVKSR